MRKTKTKRGYANYFVEEIYNKEVLGEETVEEQIETLRSAGIRYKYKVKTYVCGKYLETEIYPVYLRRRDIPRRDKENTSREVQKKLNNKNAQKKIIRLVNTNFTSKDISIDLTYSDNYLPDENEARKDIQNYIRRIKRYRKKNSLPEMRYIYAIEFLTEDERGNTKKARIHHHMIMSGMDRDVAEQMWGKGRACTDRLQPDENGLLGKALYITKYHKLGYEEYHKKGSHRWGASKNLKKPIIYEAITKLTRRKAEKIALDKNDWKELFESIYKKKYIFNQAHMYKSDFTGGFYIHARMRRD